MTRIHRTVWQKLVYRDVLYCRSCNVRRKRRHAVLDAKVNFYFSRYARCSRCGTSNVHRLSRRDEIDSVSITLISQLQRLTGAPLVKCGACRLQHYDWRPIDDRPRTS